MKTPAEQSQLRRRETKNQSKPKMNLQKPSPTFKRNFKHDPLVCGISDWPLFCDGCIAEAAEAAREAEAQRAALAAADMDRERRLTALANLIDARNSREANKQLKRIAGALAPHMERAI